MNSFTRIVNRLGGALDNRSVEVLIHEELEKHFAGNKRTVLYVGARYDYGNRDWGLSFEHYNFYHTLLNMGLMSDYSLIYFDYDRLLHRYGKSTMSNMLRQAVYYYRPDIIFYFHYLDWVEHVVWKEISDMLHANTIIWLADDHWRYEQTRPVWENFNYVVTTHRGGYEKRVEEGFDSVLMSQWGCNHFLYGKMDVPKIYDMSFVGRFYGERGEFIDTIRKSGIEVSTFGQGWDKGTRVYQSDLIRIYNESRIALNISAALKGEKVQVKGRDFEAPGCGCLLLTKDSEEISNYFETGKEIVTYEDAEDAARKAEYYLKHEEQRVRIAQNGFERVLRDHTMEKRILDIFNNIT
ncbi:MAG: glycosyltransferase [Spirochaetota bacterium]|nr:MAG: glycosyltransferase [Spirochaetota bacterium]